MKIFESNIISIIASVLTIAGISIGVYSYLEKYNQRIQILQDEIKEQMFISGIR